MELLSPSPLDQSLDIKFIFEVYLFLFYFVCNFSL